MWYGNRGYCQWGRCKRNEMKDSVRVNVDGLPYGKDVRKKNRGRI